LRISNARVKTRLIGRVKITAVLEKNGRFSGKKNFKPLVDRGLRLSDSTWAKSGLMVESKTSQS